MHTLKTLNNNNIGIAYLTLKNLSTTNMGYTTSSEV
jgi:hypothetical protein